MVEPFFESCKDSYWLLKHREMLKEKSPWNSYFHCRIVICNKQDLRLHIEWWKKYSVSCFIPWMCSILCNEWGKNLVKKNSRSSCSHVTNHVHTRVRIKVRQRLAFAFSTSLMLDFKTILKIIARDFCASNKSFWVPEIVLTFNTCLYFTGPSFISEGPSEVTSMCNTVERCNVFSLWLSLRFHINSLHIPYP